MKHDLGEALAALVLILMFFVAPIAAMVTHVIVCIKSAAWGLLIAGAILPPIGVIHGIGHWFGQW